MRIVLLEYDNIHAEACAEALRKRFPGVEISRFCYENEFREWLATRPMGVNAVILDTLVPWAKPAMDMPEPTAEAIQGVFKAGVRCAGALRAQDATIPVVFWTTFAGFLFPGGVSELGAVVAKCGDFGPLLLAVQLAVRRS